MVRTHKSWKLFLFTSDLAEVMEFSKFYISFEPKKALRIQVSVDFIPELALETYEPCTMWFVFTCGSLNSRGNGVSLIIHGDKEQMW